MSKRENMKWGTRSIVLSMLVATVVMGVSDRSLEVNAGEKVCDYIEKEESEKTACINNKYSYVVVKDGKSYHSNKEEFVKFYMEQEELGDTEGVFYENGEEMAEPENVSENQCGDSLYWNLNKDGIMTISGTGKMWDFRNDAEYFDYHECPWKEQKEQIKSVVFEEGITYIGADAFAECKNLAKVTFCDTLTYIGTFSFNLCENLENFVLPESLNYVDANAFSNCPKLTSVRIPDNVIYIGAVAFEYDTALKEVYIGGSKEAQGYRVGNSVFRGCTALENIRVSEDNIGLSEKNGVLFSKFGDILMQYPNGRTDNTYKIPEETKEIGHMAFARSQNLENIEIPNGVTVIAAYAMYDCPKLKKVVIPDTVTYIEPGIGECCFYLETIDNKSETICPLDSTSGGIVWTNEAGEVISEIGKGVAYQHRVVEKIEMVDHISVRVGESIIVPMSFSAPNYLNSQGILAKYSDLVISSSNPEVVQVTEEGVATAVTVGSSVIEVKNRYSQEWFEPVSVSCVITVEPYTPAIPTATQVPTAIPTATQVPAVTAMPIVTQVPTATQIPTVTLTPVITKKPVVPTNVPESYKINYILNKGKNNQSNPSNYTTKNIKLKAPNRKGYTFEGWYTDKNFTNSIKTIKADAKQDITIYAKWTKVKKPSKPTIKSAVNVKGEKVKVTLKKKVAGANGYEISCSIDKKWKKSVKTVTSKGITKTITKLKKNKTYYVKVRAYKLDSTGEKVYGSYSKVKKIKIQK